jgi:predicted RecA/RadA family phage recombinase
MASKFIQDGKSIRVAAPVGGVLIGNADKYGSLIGLALNSAATAKYVTLNLEGCFRLPKVAADVLVTGAALYWDDTANKLTTDSDSGNRVLAGHAIEPVSNSVAVAIVRLSNGRNTGGVSTTTPNRFSHGRGRWTANPWWCAWWNRA